MAGSFHETGGSTASGADVFVQAINDHAKKEGWHLVTTFENGTTKPLWDIAGISMSHREAQQFVLAKAKASSSIHIEALRLVMQSRVPTSTRKKR